MGLLVPLCVGLVFGVVGYVAANNHARRAGQSPWGWPPLLWAVVWFGSLFVGAVLMAIATRGSPDAAVQATATFRPSWVLRTGTILVGFPLGALLTIGGFASLLTGENGVGTSAILLLVGTAILAAAILAMMSKKGR
ncbi:MAG TPA: hypothetical protein VG076_14445 [Acidimicrobiales bacterium]|nr:hypothetical protein [Acidimicrobiales bacterium]